MAGWLAGWVGGWVSITRRYCIKTAAGKWPADSEQLNSSTINGAITSDACFKTEVGIGTAGDDLSNHRMTSSTVTDLKLLSGRSRVPRVNDVFAVMLM